MIRKLKWRFVFINMSIITIMLLMIFGMVIHVTKSNMENQSLELLRTVSLQSSTPGRPGEMEGMPFFSMKEQEGKWVADKGNFYDLSDEEYLGDIAEKAIQQNKESGVLNDYHLRFHRQNTPHGNQLTFVDITNEQATLTELIETCIIIGLISFSVFLGISIMLANWATKPVGYAWAQQKQFIADASHELKTPLTVIQTSLDLLQQTDDEQEKRKFTENISEMSARMRKLVEELLMLARMDNSRTMQKTEKVDFTRIVTDALLLFEPMFFEENRTLNSEIDRGIYVQGDTSKLRQVVDILLDNARKYSPEGSATEVTLKETEKHVLLQVKNPAPEMSESDCRNVFTRFYRMDDARSSSSSFGLGLSIARGIVLQHNGKIQAAYDDGYFSIEVLLPKKITNSIITNK